MSLRVLVADDSILYRRVLADALASLPGVEVVGAVGNGKLALQRVQELRPDLLTLDMEMPEVDGLGVLEALRKRGDAVIVIVVSAVTRHGGELTLRALEKGAFDFITKPDSASAEQSREAVRRELAPRVRTVANKVEVRNILRNGGAGNGAEPSSARMAAVAKSQPKSLEGVAGRMERLTTPGKPEMVLVGVSTGGPNALAQLLPQIPRDIGVPFFIVQHMPPIFTQSLAESLAAKCAIRVREAVPDEIAEPNTAYIAPGGKQMRLHTGPGGTKVLQITEDPPENNCRPAVDYLFRSAANQFPGRSTAVILTGMGSDGALGLRLLKRHGCFVIAQDEASCVVYGMPKAAVEAGVTDVVLPLNAIAGQITATVRRGRP